MSQDINLLTAPPSTCAACGRVHGSGIRRVVMADRIRDLGTLLADTDCPGPVTVVADARTQEAAARLLDSLDNPSVITVPDPRPGSTPVCDELTQKSLIQRIPADTGLLLAVGSGVVNDLVKWCAWERDLPYAVLPTAASMNGYTSANVAPSVNGVKTLVRARGPRALFADLDLLAGAPAELTAAGLGDVLAKTASSADWRLNHLIFGEYYCPYLVELVADLEPLYLNAPQGLRNPSPHTIRPLFEALLLTGAAMTFAGTSAPASGGEHLVSHTLDMRATVTGKAHDLHGRQVGIGTLVATALYDRIRTLESPRFTATSEANADPTYWGGLTGAVDREYARKRQRLVEAVDALNRTPGLWDRVRREVATEVHPPAVLKTCLREAGAAHRFSDIGVGFDEFLAALQHAHQIRERFTVLDLARIAGLWPGCAPEIVEEWLG